MSVQVKASIREFIVETLLSGDDRGLTETTDLQEAGLLDSLTTLSLISFLEHAFHIQLDPSDVVPETFRSIDSISVLVDNKTAGGAGSAR